MKESVVAFVKSAVGDPEEVATVMAMAGFFEHILGEGLAVVDQSITGLPALVKGPFVEVVENLASRAKPDPAERQGRLDGFLAELRQGQRDGVGEPGPLLQRVLEADLPGLGELAKDRLEGLPGTERLQFVIDKATPFLDAVGRPGDVEELKIDLATVEGLVAELAPAARTVSKEIVDDVAAFSRRVHGRLTGLLTREVYIQGVSEAYGFLTATPADPRGRSLSLLAALCFALAHQIVRQLQGVSLPVPLTAARIEAVAGLDLAALAPGADLLRQLLDDAFSDPATVEMSSDESSAPAEENLAPVEAEPVLDQLGEEAMELVEFMIGLLDWCVKFCAALVGTGMAKEDQGVVGVAINTVGLVTSLLRGPFFGTINAVGFIAAKSRGETLPPGAIAASISAVFLWLAWLLEVAIFSVQVAVERFDKQVAPHVVSVLGLLGAVANFGAFVAAIVEIGIVRDRPGAALANATVGYLEDQVGMSSDALDFLKGPPATAATSGASAPAKWVLERGLPWLEWVILSGALAASYPEGVVLFKRLRT